MSSAKGAASKVYREKLVTLIGAGGGVFSRDADRVLEGIESVTSVVWRVAGARPLALKNEVGGMERVLEHFFLKIFSAP